MSTRTLLISDVHLDRLDDARTRAFMALLERPPGPVSELFLLGDIFEMWIGDDDDDPLVTHVADALATLAERGVSVHFMHGNRDFLLGTGFADRCGMTLLGETATIERHGRRHLLCHGDTLCTDDTAYQQLRSVMRSSAWQQDMLARPLAERRRIGAELRAASRAANGNKPDRIMDVNQDAVVEQMRTHEADWLVHGHTHRPNLHPLVVPAGDGGWRRARRLVLGDWDRFAWWGLLDAGGASLHCRPIDPD